MSFTKIASLYKAFRPQYTEVFARRIMDNIQKLSPDSGRDIAVDVGCGNGQLTTMLSPYFNKVYGMDVSQGQIDIANAENTLDNVEYRVGKCEILPFKESSVDLISAAQCLHWMDSALFYPEVDRVLKPNGCLVVSFYAPIPELFYKNDRISNELNRISKKFQNIFIEGDYLGERPKKAVLFREDLLSEIPYINQHRDRDFSMLRRITVSKFCGLLASKTYYVNYMNQNPGSLILNQLRDDLCNVLRAVEHRDPDKVEMEAKFWCDILVTCKTSLPMRDMV